MEKNGEGDVTSTLPLEHHSPDGKRRRFLGKSIKKPGGASKTDKASAPVEDADDATAQVDDFTLETYANAKEDKRRNERGGGHRKRKNGGGDGPKKKKRRNGGGKATGRRGHGPRKRFAIHGGKVRKL